MASADSHALADAWWTCFVNSRRVSSSTPRYLMDRLTGTAWPSTMSSGSLKICFLVSTIASVLAGASCNPLLFIHSATAPRTGLMSVVADSPFREMPRTQTSSANATS
ncbi:unnamed protein product [Macrosiphum euphorbiae]|uniref:Uncharacterized protein n=1 Tax=Macrosiphum euphorbiae TaxID=13131 RepID=A0AAV0X6P9_9HEMI|nr:unnamed protein product [Macrosiphum euphorbiae]